MEISKIAEGREEMSSFRTGEEKHLDGVTYFWDVAIGSRSRGGVEESSEDEDSEQGCSGHPQAGCLALR